MTIEAAENGTVVLNATTKGRRVFYVGNGGVLELIGLNITGGDIQTNSGGGLCVDTGGEANLMQCDIRGNVAGYGGGVSVSARNAFAKATLTLSTISGNRAEDRANRRGGYGGGLYFGRFGTTTLISCTISGNDADGPGGGFGGGLMLTEGGGTFDVKVTSCVISNNEAQRGGGLVLAGGQMTITTSIIRGNAARNTEIDGGVLPTAHAIYIAVSTAIVKIDRSTLIPGVDPCSQRTHTCDYLQERLVEPGGVRIDWGECAPGFSPGEPSAGISMNTTVNGCPTECPATTYSPGGDSLALYDETEGCTTGCKPCSEGGICPDQGMGAPQWCMPGSYMDFNSSGSPACLNASLGQYQDEPRAMTYKVCEAGRFSIVLGSTACESCDTGGYCEEPGASSASVFKLCPPGTWSDTVEANSSASCRNCSAGTYSPISGATNASDCRPCRKGGLCQEGAPEPIDCVAGRFMNETGATACMDCTLGAFCPPGAAAALPCNGGSFGNSTGFLSQEDCHPCPPGHFCFAGSTEASPCSAGTYAKIGKNQLCDECVAGRFMNGTGATACHECTIGSYCEQGAAAALPCSGGSFGNTTGLTTQDDCHPCPPGHFCFAGAVEASVCGAGTYAKSERSKVCDACEEGTYQDAEGATACVVCDDGYICKKGSVAPIPAECAEGSFFNATLAKMVDNQLDACLGCPAGHFCVGGQNPARKCSRGGYCLANASKPTDCAAGRFGNETGLSDETCSGGCPPGYYCEEGASTPLPCASGSYNNRSLVGSADSCEPCPSGSFCPTGAAIHALCAPGTYAPEPGMDSCDPCPAGTYQRNPGKTACKNCTEYSWCSEGSSAPTPCAAGTVGRREGLISADQCDACPPGFWCSAGKDIACGASTYSNTSNAANEGTCTPCPDNSRSRSGSTSIDACTCNKDFYDTKPAVGEVECELCPVGSNCSLSGATLESLPVLDGYYRTSALSNDLLECPTIGGVSGSARCRAASSEGNGTCVDNLSGIYCTVCPPRHYMSTAGDSTCVPCGGMTDATLLVYAAVVAATLLFVAVAALSARPSFGGSRSGRAALTQRLAVLAEASGLGSKLKQLVSFYQMATSIQSAFIVTFPDSVRRLLSVFELFSLNLFELGLPLECMGLAAFMARLTFMMIAPLVLIVLGLPLSLFLMLRRRDEWRAQGGLRALLLYVLPMVLKLLFVVFPLVSAVAVQAFDCEEYDNDEAWLRADFSLKCGDLEDGRGSKMHPTDEYKRVRAVAWLAVVLYPVGVPLLFLGLLLSCRKQLSRQAPSTPLSTSIAFLCAEYRKRFFVWEALESVKKIFFISLVRLVSPGTLSQLLLALVVALSCLVYQLTAAPFKRSTDNFLGVISGTAYSMMLVGALTLKLKAIYDKLNEEGNFSLQLEDTFKVPSLPVLVLLLCSTIAAISFSVAILLREALRDMRQPKLRYVGSHTLVAVPLPTGKTHHLFISHVWGTAQDQARVLRQRLQSVAPGLRVWLDVEDLTDISALEEAVDASWTLLILVTAGYFQSKNCMRELVRCIETDTPRIAVAERDAAHGGLTEAEARQQCVAAGAKFAQWGFDANGPTADALADALLGAQGVGGATVGTSVAAGKPGVADDGSPIVYERIGVFQQPMLRMIVQRLVGSREIYLPGELCVSRRPGALAPPVRTYHIWCSRHNPGALEVVNELKHVGGYEGRLLVTEEPGAMAEADHVLLYLSLATWADDGQRKTDLTAEIKGALQVGRKLLLVHETDEEKGGVQQFGHFFGADQTPGELLGLQIYAEIAIGMKAPPYRTVSLGLFDQAVRAGSPGRQRTRPSFRAAGRRFWAALTPKKSLATVDVAQARAQYQRRLQQGMAQQQQMSTGSLVAGATVSSTVSGGTRGPMFSRLRRSSTAGDSSARVSTELHSPSTAAAPRGWARSVGRRRSSDVSVDQECVSLRDEDSAADPGASAVQDPHAGPASPQRRGGFCLTGAYL